MGNSIIYPESNQLPRNSFSCGQSRQAVSVYHSNSQMRMDKMGVTLNYGQTPLIKSRYLDYINREEQPYGVNAIVAIMSYTGYNVEDAILINEGSVKRGIFRTNYYTTYEAREESSKVSGSNVNSFFTNIESKPNVKGVKDGFDYSKLDSYGLVKENTPIDDRIVLIGEVTTMSDQKGEYMDNSKTTKKGQLGFVDKAFISEGEEGFRIAKIRIREERIPTIGDKFASRAGQKGTIGLLVPEEDMPFTSDGVRPDLIINPHALPSRMTIGQLVESLFGKACCMYGGYGDCTAFSTKGASGSVGAVNRDRARPLDPRGRARLHLHPLRPLLSRARRGLVHAGGEGAGARSHQRHAACRAGRSHLASIGCRRGHRCARRPGLPVARAGGLHHPGRQTGAVPHLPLLAGAAPEPRTLGVGEGPLRRHRPRPQPLRLCRHLRAALGPQRHPREQLTEPLRAGCCRASWAGSRPACWRAARAPR